MSESPSNAVFLIAAISVIVFSVVGIGVMTGIIPGFVTQEAETPAAKSGSAAATRAEAARAKTEAPAAASKTGDSAPGAALAPAATGCSDCGQVELVRLLKSDPTPQSPQTEKDAQSGKAGGAKAADGGSDRVEENKPVRYDVVVRMPDGTTRIFSFDTQPIVQAGDFVKVVGGALTVHKTDVSQ